MVKTILVPTTGLPSDEIALETAYRTASLFDAHIECLHVRPDASEMIRGGPVMDGSVSLALPEIWSALESEAKARAAMAKKSFDAFCARNVIAMAEKPAATKRVTAQWNTVEGGVRAVTLMRAHYNDLVVYGRSRREFDPSLDDISDVVVASGKPVLLSPRHAPPKIATTVAIAWKETAEAARAVSAAMPFLAKAEKILVLAATERLATEAISSMERLAASLRWHGFAPEVDCLETDSSGAPEAVLAASKRRNVDLLVMGGYGHSRAREYVLGGFTQHMLNKSDVPLFLYH